MLISDSRISGKTSFYSSDIDDKKSISWFLGERHAHGLNS